MLNAADLQRVKDYVFEGFPEVRPRVAIRKFNPPVKPDSGSNVLGDMNYRNWLVSHKKMIRDDILGQIPWSLQTNAKLAFHNAVGWGFWAYWKDKYDFLESCLSQTPYAFPIRSLSATRKELEGPQLFYVAQLSDRMSDDKFFEWVFEGRDISHLPDDTRRIVEIMIVVHELGHTLPGNYLTDAHKQECVCDVLGAAGVLSIVGERAIPVLDMFAESRINTDTAVHFTAPVLKKALEEDSPLLAKVNVEGAYHYAEHLYQTLDL